MAVVERLTKQNHDLEEQLRQRGTGHNVQEENQEDSSEWRGKGYLAKRAAKHSVGTIVRTPTGETPFWLAYRNDAVIPAEVGLTSYRVENYADGRNEEAIRFQLDLVDEVRATAEQRLVRYQNLMAKHYNFNVRHRDFQVRDLVLRKVMGATKGPSQGKLRLNWEGPYRITSCQRKGTYHLETLDGRKLQHPWNTEHL